MNDQQQQITLNAPPQKADCRMTPLACIGGQRRTYVSIDQPFRDHVHDHYVIGRVHAGTRSLLCNGQAYTIAPPDLIVLNPGDVHGCERCTYQPFSYDSITVGRSVLDGVVLRAPVVSDPCAVRLFDELTVQLDAQVDEDRIIESLFHLVSVLEVKPEQQVAGEDGLSEDTAGKGSLGEGAVAENAAGEKASSESAHHEAVLRVYAHMRSHCGEPLGLAALAKQVGLSHYALIRAYRLQFGITPLQHLNAMRVDWACDLLARGSAVADVALETGFADQAHLTRMFKQRMGVTPAAYRRMMMHKD